MIPNFLNLNIVEIGLFAIGIAYIYTYWKQGGAKAVKDVLIAYKDQIALNTQKIAELNHEVGILKGQLLEKDKQINLLESLVKTTPEQHQYMGDMRMFTEKLGQYMNNSTKILNEINISLHNLNNNGK